MLQKISTGEIMQLMTHNSLRLYKAKGSKATLPRVIEYDKAAQGNSYSKGMVFVSRSKENLISGKGYVVTSYETLQEKEGKLSHWTPNTFRGGSYYNFKDRIIKGHTRDNLKQINVIGFDIDTKDVDLYSLFIGCEELGLPRPNLLLETPKGYQGFFLLETPFYIHRNKDYKALRVAERLAENMLAALKKYVPVDINCAPFGFYRIPNKDNIVYFNAEPANTKNLMEWSKEFEVKERKDRFYVIYPREDAAPQQTSSPWYKMLLRAQHITSGNYASSRNNTLFTLALANYQDGVPYEDMYDELDQFNSNLENPLPFREFKRIIKSAYSGHYNGVKRSYVDSLLELWTETKEGIQRKIGWYKFKKKREERERSHYEEWEDDILNYIHTNASPEAPFVEGSLRRFSEAVGIASSTLKEVLKRSKKLIKHTIGKGRGAVSKWTSRSMLLRNLLFNLNNQKQTKQLHFKHLLDQINDFPLLLVDSSNGALSRMHDFDLLYRMGKSPTVRDTS